MYVKKINWGDVPVEEVNPSMKRQIISGEKMMIARMHFKDGFRVPLHSHENEQITYCISGKMRFWFGENKEEVMDLNPGDVVVIPGPVGLGAVLAGEALRTDLQDADPESGERGQDAPVEGGNLAPLRHDHRHGLFRRLALRRGTLERGVRFQPALHRLPLPERERRQ